MKSKIDRELMRGAGPVAVLNLLAKHEMYGYELVQALARDSDGVLEMRQSTLYPMLYNLEAKGLIEPRWQEMESGRRRKYYSLTLKGQEKLAGGLEQWRALAGAMRKLGILGPNPQGTDS